VRRSFRLLIGPPVLAGGVVLGLYGLIALLYRDHSSGSTYVTLFARRMDAHAVGAIALSIALTVIFVSVWAWRRSES
jgi:hypothetical protein